MITLAWKQLPYRLSASAMGSLNAPDFCARCWALERILGPKPFRMGFPGIFRAIDTHCKALVRGSIDRTGTLPEWMPDLGVQVKGYLQDEELHYTKFASAGFHGMTLRAIPDEVFLTKRGCFIIDYKTAKFTDTQEELFPRYVAQLNSEYVIAQRLGLKPLGLALIYCEPISGQKVADMLDLRFGIFLKPVKADVKLIARLCGRAKRIIRQVNAGFLPKGRAKCEGCSNLLEFDGKYHVVTGPIYTKGG